MKKMLMIGAGLALAPMSVAAEPYTCEDLGYVFDKGGCLDETTMVRCPMNLERVWCVGGEMCGKYPVKGAACNDGAKIEWCDLTENMDQSSKRCKYESEDCNSGWEKGILNNVTGNTANCCKDGWDLNPTTGVCEEHVCNKIRYPYTTDDYTYADYAGEIETCRSGNVINFGYVSCNNMWQRGSSNAGDAGYYKCLCKRTDYDNGYVFPFDKSTFYTTFGSGRYGDYHMCADAENSYYGYEHCFRGYEMELTNGKKNGACRVFYSVYCNITSSVTNQPWQSWDPKMDQIRQSGYKCIYQTYGNKNCTAENQNYEECTACFSADALTESGEPYIKLCKNGDSQTYGYINHCPYKDQIFVGDTINTGNAVDSGNHRPEQNDYYGSCYGTCQWQSKSCRKYDIVMKDGKTIGIIYEKSGNTYYLIALVSGNGFNKNNGGWDAAKAWIKSYTPDVSVCPSGSGCEAGKWIFTDASNTYRFAYGTQRMVMWPIIQHYGRFVTNTSYNYSSPAMSSTVGSNGFVYINYDWDTGWIDKNSDVTAYAYPVLLMEGK